jgi:hypothetical protein
LLPFTRQYHRLRRPRDGGRLRGSFSNLLWSTMLNCGAMLALTGPYDDAESRPTSEAEDSLFYYWAYSARNIFAGSMRTARITAGSAATIAAIRIVSDGTASAPTSVAFTS